MPFDGTDWETNADLRMLRRARDGIAQPGGWCQGNVGSAERRCAVGWIDAVDGDAWRDAVQRLLVPALPWWARAFGDDTPIGTVAMYNDRFWRRQKTMVKLFDRAIRRLERA